MTKPIIYQLLPRLFMQDKGAQSSCGTLSQNGCGKLNDITPNVLKRIRELGTTHVWYTGIIRHASTTSYKRCRIPSQHPDVVKGKAGSPYAIADYYDVCPDLATDVKHRRDEFVALTERTHKAGMKVIIDFIPNHVAREYQSVCSPKGVADLGANDDTTIAFSPQNNFYYLPGTSLVLDTESQDYKEEPAKATGNDVFHEHPQACDWYDTVKLNYGVPPLCSHLVDDVHPEKPFPTWQAMLHILRYWAEMGVDGFRCDMADMVPVAFWSWVIHELRKDFPQLIFIGESYEKAHYHALLDSGFDWLYDKIGMYDTLIAVAKGERPVAAITRQWQETDDINERLLYFLENHDEQRLASAYILDNARAAMPALLVGSALKTNPFMVYFGQEVGEKGMEEEGFSGKDGRTSIYDYWCVESVQRAYFNPRTMKKEERLLRNAYKDILKVTSSAPAICKGKMFDLMYVNPQLEHQYAFFRQSDKQLLLVVANFSHEEAVIHLHIPQHAMDWLALEDGSYAAYDLLNKENLYIQLKGETDIPLHLDGYGTYVFDLKM